MTKAELLKELLICPEVQNPEPSREPNQLTRRMSDSSLSDDNEMVSYGWK
jgi:hypothetical protein